MKFTQLYKEIQRMGIPITSRNFRALIECLKYKTRLIRLSK